MIRIRQEQVEALRADRLERFIRDMAGRAAILYPAEATPFRVRKVIERAIAAGIERERDVIAFIDLNFRFAPRFEEDWVRELLGQTALSAALKMELLRNGLGVRGGP